MDLDEWVMKRLTDLEILPTTWSDWDVADRRAVLREWSVVILKLRMRSAAIVADVRCAITHGKFVLP